MAFDFDAPGDVGGGGLFIEDPDVGDLTTVEAMGAAASAGFEASRCMEGGEWTGFVWILGIPGEVGLSDAGLKSRFGVVGKGTNLGERIPLGSVFSASLVLAKPVAGELTFSANNGFVMVIFAGIGFLDAATFAAWAPIWRIARFCSGVTLGVGSSAAAAGFEAAAVAAVVVAAAAAVDVAEVEEGCAGFAGIKVGAVETPRASISSSYSFHSSTCSRS